MSYPDCPVCGATVLHLDVEQIIREYMDRGGFMVQVPSAPGGYSFEPCGHRIVDQERVEAYTAAQATSNSDNLTP